ncbi:MAG: low molecular weight protein-tyrosine-phosphatase [Alcanivoracaceae bacterium]
MFKRILVVCDGNICRSPTVVAMLQRQMPERDISSAGLMALVGQEMDETARVVAAENGLSCPLHRARQLNATHCADADVILVMERRQRDRLMQQFPTASGKVFLLAHWSDGQDIADPYRRDRETFLHIYELMDNAVALWRPRLG